MVFMCQRDSFLKEFTSTVKSCKKSELKTVSDGKKVKYDGYDVVLDDTILFPEGGGQPCDYGWLNENRVIQVSRQADKAIHFVKEAIDEGTVVHQRLDWERRFDHMQQHSGQHLLSAILEKQYNLNTTSWWLGEEESYVELDCAKITDEVMREVEEKCNDAIRNSVPVKVKICEKGDPELNEAHTRGLPADHTGLIRIIYIEGIDENLCCGTHVTNLGQLQMIKLLRPEPGKKNKINLKFLVGKRVTKQFQKCLEREQALTGLLKNDSSRHAELVEKLQKSLKLANKNLLTTFKEIASVEANNIKLMDPLPKYACFHRKEGDMEYVKALSRELDETNIFYFIAVGDGKQGGNVLMRGDEKHIEKLAPQICEILKGKGAGKSGRYQARVDDLTGVAKCNKLIEEHFANIDH